MCKLTHRSTFTTFLILPTLVRVVPNGYMYDCNAEAGIILVLNIRRQKEEGHLRHFVSNDEQYALNNLPSQKLLNMAHCSSCWKDIADCYGPPCCFPFSNSSLCQDLRSAIGEDCWLFGVVSLTHEAHNATYTAACMETETGQEDGRRLATKYFWFCNPESLDEDKENLMRQVRRIDALSTEQKEAVHGFLQLSMTSPEEEECPEEE